MSKLDEDSDSLRSAEVVTNDNEDLVLRDIPKSLREHPGLKLSVPFHLEAKNLLALISTPEALEAMTAEEIHGIFQENGYQEDVREEINHQEVIRAEVDIHQERLGQEDDHQEIFGQEIFHEEIRWEVNLQSKERGHRVVRHKTRVELWHTRKVAVRAATEETVNLNGWA